jgi:hypothetical protein
VSICSENWYTNINSDPFLQDSGNYICTATNAGGSVDIPTILTVTGVVPYFTQAPSSYMTLPTLPDSYLTFDIQISFKPEDKNGKALIW